MGVRKSDDKERARARARAREEYFATALRAVFAGAAVLVRHIVTVAGRLQLIKQCP
jgi:hypothetical protein